MLVVSALIAFNALLIWVATAPRSLSAVTPYIESVLVSPTGNFHVAIGDTKLFWDGWEHPIDIRLMDVVVINKENQIFTSLPEISLGLDLLSLPFGRVVPTSLVIKKPTMNLLQNADNSISIGFNNGAAADAAPAIPFKTIIDALSPSAEENNFSRLKKILIRDAQVSVSNEKLGMFFDAKAMNISITRSRRGVMKISAVGDIFYKDYTSSVSSEFSFIPDQQVINGAVSFSALMPNILAGLFTENQDIKGFSLPISGKINLAIDMDGAVQQLFFDVMGGKGEIKNAKLAAPLPITAMQARGAFSNDFSDLKIENFTVQIDDMAVSASGAVNALNDNSPEIYMEMLLKNIPAKMLKTLWPPSLAPLSREWVTENITDGSVPQGRVVIDIKKGDLDKKILPKEAVDAKLELAGLKIRYLPEHPAVTEVKGGIHIDGVALAADIESAKYLDGTALTNGRVLIDDLNADNPYIKVDLHADAPASDMVHFLSLPRLNHAEHLGLVEKDAKGRVKGSAEVGFYFFSPKGKNAEDAIKYNVKADLENISQPNFLNNFVVKNLNGSATIDNKGIVVSSTGGGENAPSTLGKGTVKYSFEPQNGYDTFIDLDSADLSETMAKSDSGFSFQNFPALMVRAKIDSLNMGNKNIISKLAGEIQCSAVLCSNADISGKTADKPFSIKIFRDAKNLRKLAVRSEDAGSFLQAIGAFNGMNGGVLALNGSYKEAASGSTLTAKITVSEHTIKDAPILGKLLALSSLTGFIDTLQGNGIRFEELTVPFTLKNDVATLEQAKTYGSAIGLTMDGTITFPKKNLDLHGTIVPSYTLNNVVGKVPLLGDMLTGGEGQGVFAARYTMKGTSANPDITVNPLSILTPGFLRGLFDVFDDGEKKAGK